MYHYIRPDDLIHVQPEQIQQYLEGKGWKIAHTVPGKFLIYRLPGDSNSEILVPTEPQFRDYTRRVVEVIRDLAKYHSIPIESVFNRITGIGMDGQQQVAQSLPSQKDVLSNIRRDDNNLKQYINEGTPQELMMLLAQRRHGRFRLIEISDTDEEPITETPLADPQAAASIALLQSWIAQAPTDPEEIRVAEEDLREFQRNMNANRARTGERIPYPDVE